MACSGSIQRFLSVGEAPRSLYVSERTHTVYALGSEHADLYAIPFAARDVPRSRTLGFESDNMVVDEEEDILYLSRRSSDRRTWGITAFSTAFEYRNEIWFNRPLRKFAYLPASNEICALTSAGLVYLDPALKTKRTYALEGYESPSVLLVDPDSSDIVLLAQKTYPEGTEKMRHWYEYPYDVLLVSHRDTTATPRLTDLFLAGGLNFTIDWQRKRIVLVTASNDVQLFELETGRMLSTVPVPATEPVVEVVLDAPRGILYLDSRTGLVAYDYLHNRMGATYSLTPRGRNLRPSPLTNHLIIGNFADNALEVLDVHEDLTLEACLTIQTSMEIAGVGIEGALGIAPSAGLVFLTNAQRMIVNHNRRAIGIMTIYTLDVG